MSTVIRWNPFREMAAMQSAMDRIFDETWNSTRGNGGATRATLPLDVHETDERYTVLANVPGAEADNINVSFQDGVLTISANVPQPEAEEGTNVLLQERRFGEYSRSITLPQPVDTDNVEANFNDGVLTLELPKVPEVQPRQIPVKAAVK